MKCDITGNCFKWHTPTHTSTAISISIIPCTAHQQNNTTAHTEAHSTVCESLRHRASIQRRWKSCTIWHWRNRKWAHIYVLLRWINTHTLCRIPKSEAQSRRNAYVWNVTNTDAPADSESCAAEFWSITRRPTKDATKSNASPYKSGDNGASLCVCFFCCVFPSCVYERQTNNTAPHECVTEWGEGGGVPVVGLVHPEYVRVCLHVCQL